MLDKLKSLMVELTSCKEIHTCVILRYRDFSQDNSTSTLAIVRPLLDLFDETTGHTNYHVLVDKEVRVFVIVYLL